MHLWLDIIKISNTKSQETEPKHNISDVVCSMSIQFPEGFQFQGNFLIALALSGMVFLIKKKIKEKKNGKKMKE